MCSKLPVACAAAACARSCEPPDRAALHLTCGTPEHHGSGLRLEVLNGPLDTVEPDPGSNPWCRPVETMNCGPGRCRCRVPHPKRRTGCDVDNGTDSRSRAAQTTSSPSNCQVVIHRPSQPWPGDKLVCTSSPTAYGATNGSSPHPSEATPVVVKSNETFVVL